MVWNLTYLTFADEFKLSTLQPKVFSKSETVASRVLASTKNPNRIIYSQTQEYTMRVFGSKKVGPSTSFLGLLLTGV